MLPGYNVNAMIDVSPVTNAINQNRANAMADEKLGMERERFGMEKQRFNEQRQEAIKQKAGNLALLALSEKDPAIRQQKWQKIISTHPGAADLDPKYHDVSTGALALLADAGMAQHYLDYQLKQASEARSAAAEGRAAGLYPLQRQAAELDVATRKRDFNNPTERFQSFPEGSTIIGQTPGGGQRIVQTGNEKAPAEHVAKASNFAARMIEAERNIRRVLDGADPIDPAAPKGKKFEATSAGVLATNALPEAARNMVISNEHQQYRQAAEQWIRAFLRKESGAAIGKDEFARDFVVYFPQPGDRPDVVAQKQAARAAAMHGVASEGATYFTKTNPDYARHLEAFKMPAQSQAPVRVRTPDEARRLPSGTPIILPDGSPGRVP